MKKCKICETEKQVDDFYKNDSTCKECRKEKVRAYRLDNIEYYRAYDRKRGNRLPEGYQKEYRDKYPNKYKAKTMVNNAKRDGKLFEEPCEICKATEYVHAHHDDYLKPLNVRWLCAAHHKQWHVKHGEAKNP